jgi:hypothetical protein
MPGMERGPDLARSTVRLGAERLVVADRAVDLFGHLGSRGVETVQIGLCLIEVGRELLPDLHAILGTCGRIGHRCRRDRRQAVQRRRTLSDAADRHREQGGGGEASVSGAEKGHARSAVSKHVHELQNTAIDAIGFYR